MTLDVARGGAERSAPPAEPRDGALRRHTVDLAAPLVYLALACWLFWPLLRHLRSAQMGGPDTALFTWWIGWTPHALAHGLSPFVSHALNVPGGVNAMWNTSVPLLGLLMAPITETLGPVAAINLLLVLAPVLSACAAYAAARSLSLRPVLCALVGLLYGFSTYDLAQDGSGHLHLSMAVFPPAAVALLHRAVSGRTSPRRAGLLLGLAGVLQLWISEEMLATAGILTLVTAIAVAVFMAWRDTDLLLLWAGRLARTAGWAALVAVPLALPALLVQFVGPERVTAGIVLPAISQDLATAITPTRQVLVHRLLPFHVLNTVQQGNFDEVTGYIGLPLLALLVAGRRRIAASPLRWTLVPLAAAMVLALGWQVRVFGVGTDLRGPQQYFARLPVLSSVLTVRFSLYVVLLTAILLAVVAEAWLDGGPRLRRWAAAGVALVVVAVLPWPSAHITRIAVPSAVASQAPLPGLPDGATVAMLPWPTTENDDAMRWQAVDDFHFRLLGGYGIFPDGKGVGYYGTSRPRLDIVAERLSHGGHHVPPTGSYAQRQELAELADWQHTARALVIGPAGDSAAVAGYVEGLLGRRPERVGGVYLFRFAGR